MNADCLADFPILLWILFNSSNFTLFPTMSHFYILIVGETSISWWSIYLTPTLTYRNIIIKDKINKI